MSLILDELAEEHNVPWELPCLGVVSAPGCQEPWNLPGSRLGRSGVDLESSILPHPASETFGRCSKGSTSLSHTTTVLSLRGALAWNNFCYTFFSCLTSFSVCLHLCHRSCFQPCADVWGPADQQLETQGTSSQTYQTFKRLTGQK